MRFVERFLFFILLQYFDSLIPAMDREPEYLLNAVHCLPLDPEVRSSIGAILNVQVKEKRDSFVFSLLLY